MSHEVERKNAPIVKTIKRALLIFKQFGQTKLLIFKSLSSLFTVCTVITAVFSKSFFNTTADVIKGDMNAFLNAICWLVIWIVIEFLISMIVLLPLELTIN